MKNLVALVAMCLILIGCETLPGGVSTHISDFDGTREVSMEPAVVPTGSMVARLRIGAYWSSKNPEVAYLIAETAGATRVRREAGLELSLDGDITSLDSDETFTEIDRAQAFTGDSQTWSSRGFTTSPGFIEKLRDASDIRVRLRIGQTEYIEGRIETDGMNAGVYNGLGAFVEEVERQKQELE